MSPEFLPSKKILIIGALLAVFIGWLFWVPTTDTFKLKSVEFGRKQLAEQSAAENAASELDSDHDGLKDWEEALWHTDPHNPDTDGDGTPDGEEIRLGRNPLVPGPNDLITDTANIFNGSATGTPQEINLTESVSKKLLAAYLQSGSKDSASLKALSKSIAAQNIPPPFEDEFTTDNIMIGGDNSLPALKKYLDSVGSIVTANLHQTDDVVKIITTVNQNNDFTLLNNLSKNIDAYRQIVTSLKNVRTPSVFGSAHLDLINTMNNAAKAVAEIKKMESDPLLFSHGWQEYLTVDTRAKNITLDINAIIKNRGIVLTPSDPGYAITIYSSQVQ